MLIKIGFANHRHLFTLSGLFMSLRMILQTKDINVSLYLLSDPDSRVGAPFVTCVVGGIEPRD